MVGLSVESVRRLAELVEKHSLAELTVEENGLCITIKGHEAPANGAAQGDSSAAGALPPVVLAESLPRALELAPAGAEVHPAAMQPAKQTPPVAPLAENLRQITAPMVGVFYRTPAPDAPPYVEIGDQIEEEQTIGLIEAMKVFSEIPSEFGGEVVETPAHNGKLVQQGDPLVVVRVAEELL